MTLILERLFLSVTQEQKLEEVVHETNLNSLETLLLTELMI